MLREDVWELWWWSQKLSWTLLQLGANQVCVILSHRHDTSFEASFRHRKKYLADVLSLDPCNEEYIHSKIPFQIIFRAKQISYLFFKFRIHEIYKVSRLHDTITERWYYHREVILSRRGDASTTAKTIRTTTTIKTTSWDWAGPSSAQAGIGPYFNCL